MCSAQNQGTDLPAIDKSLLFYWLEIRMHVSQYLLQHSDFCAPHASVHCIWDISIVLTRDFTETGLNPYDIRRKCDRSEGADGPLCYKQMGWVEAWMNNPANKAALGVNPDRPFANCNADVNRAFTMNGDGMHNSAALLPELVDAGIRLLVYAGNAGKLRAIPFTVCDTHWYQKSGIKQTMRRHYMPYLPVLDALPAVLLGLMMHADYLSLSCSDMMCNYMVSYFLEPLPLPIDYKYVYAG